MKHPHGILEDVLDHPQSSEVMECALRNLIDRSEQSDITQEEIAVYLCSAMGQDYYSK
jgi:hypothetical protein